MPHQMTWYLDTIRSYFTQLFAWYIQHSIRFESANHAVEVVVIIGRGRYVALAQYDVGGSIVRWLGGTRKGAMLWS